MIDFSDLYQKYAPHVFRFALYLCGNTHDAEDITSETFVRAFAAPDRIEAATVKAYLFAIARNLFLMGIRAGARQAVLKDDTLDFQPSPYDRAEQKAAFAAVLPNLRKLPELDRTALLMRTLEEWPYEEIAQVLKISVVSARVKVHRARAALLKIGRTDDLCT